MTVNPDWGDPFTTPAETIPGPSNPWVACGGSGGAVAPKPEHELILPDLDHLEGSAGVNWKLVGGGIVVGAFGVALLVIAAVLAIIAIVGAAVPGALQLIIIAAIIMAVGGSATIIGGGMIAAGIDPPVADYRRKVLPPNRRKVAIARDAPRELVELLDNIYEVEHLVSGEIDLLDSARAAAAMKDDKWYETHVRDLYTVQSRKNHFIGKASQNIEEFVSSNQKMLDDVKLDFSVPLRDSINPITELRNLVGDLGMNSGEIDGIIFQARTQSPLMEINRKNAAKMLAESDGDTSKLLKRLATELKKIEFIDWDAFGGEPKR